MKHTHKLVAFTLTAVLAMAGFSAYSPNVKKVIAAEKVSDFKSIKGTVKAVRAYTNPSGTTDANKKFIDVKTSSGDATFFVDENSYVEGTMPNTGDQIEGFYNPKKPMVDIFPPRYDVEVVARQSGNKTYKLDSFSGDLVSSDGSLKIIANSNSNIFDESGNKYTGSIKNKVLFVTYSTSTKSIPAQTTPEKIVVVNVEKFENTTKTSNRSSFTGKITEVTKGTDGVTNYIIEDTSGSKIMAKADKNTLLLDGELSKDTNAEVHYLVPEVMTLQYPPSYLVDVIAKTNVERNIKVDKFNSQLVSADNTLKLNVDENTVIMNTQKQVYTSSIENKLLAVAYDISTRSIPAQTTPKAIYVLNDRTSGNTGNTTEEVPPVLEDPDLIPLDGRKYILSAIVDNKPMLSLADIAHIFGFDVSISTERSTMNNGYYVVTAGQNSYMYGDKEVVLSSEAIAYLDRIYVPMDYLDNVLGYTGYHVSTNGNVNFN